MISIILMIIIIIIFISIFIYAILKEREELGCYRFSIARQCNDNNSDRCVWQSSSSSGDYPSNSTVNFFKLNGLNIKPYPFKFDYRVDKGLIKISSNTKQFTQLNNDSSLYTIINDGIYFILIFAII